MYPNEFKWRQNAYEYVFDKNPMDVVCGTDRVRKAIEGGVALNEIESGWADGLIAFKQLREKYLLY